LYVKQNNTKTTTAELLSDLRGEKTPTVILDLFLNGVKVEKLTEYKSLGTFLNKLNVNKNTDFIHKRCQPGVFCLS